MFNSPCRRSDDKPWLSPEIAVKAALTAPPPPPGGRTMPRSKPEWPLSRGLQPLAVVWFRVWVEALKT